MASISKPFGDLMQKGNMNGGLNADGWRNILDSNIFGYYGEDLRKSVAAMVRKVLNP